MNLAVKVLNKTYKLAILAIFLAATGWGCNWFKSANLRVPDMRPAGPRPADLENVSPAEASKRINFVQGSRIKLVPTYNGESAKPAEDGNNENVRFLTVERFAPQNVANFSWQLNQRVETEDSKKAREDYEKAKAAAKPDQTPPKEPETATEVISVSGGLSDLNLKNGHGLFLPAYWPADKASAVDTSGIWLSRDVYEELTKTHVSTVYLNILDSGFYGPLSKSKEFTQALAAMDAARAKIVDRVDPDLMTSEKETSEWTLKVNDKDVKVQVLKAKNWFGEIVVLDNPQNPIILKLKLDPTVADSFLQTLAGFEVTELSGVE